MRILQNLRIKKEILNQIVCSLFFLYDLKTTWFCRISHQQSSLTYSALSLGSGEGIADCIHLKAFMYKGINAVKVYVIGEHMRLGQGAGLSRWCCFILESSKHQCRSFQIYMFISLCPVCNMEKIQLFCYILK